MDWTSLVYYKIDIESFVGSKQDISKYLQSLVDVENKPRCMAHHKNGDNGEHQGHHGCVSTMPSRHAVVNPGWPRISIKREEGPRWFFTLLQSWTPRSWEQIESPEVSGSWLQSFQQQCKELNTMDFSLAMLPKSCICDPE